MRKIRGFTGLLLAVLFLSLPLSGCAADAPKGSGAPQQISQPKGGKTDSEKPPEASLPESKAVPGRAPESSNVFSGLTESGAAPSSQAAEQTGGNEMKVQVGNTEFTAVLAENSSVEALRELLADGPLTLKMSDYAGMEKGADLGTTLPENNEPMDTVPGDIILYQGRTLVIYYGTNSWSLTPIGKISGAEESSLREALGDGDVTVTLSLVQE